MHNQLEADVDAIDMAEAVLMERLNRDRIIEHPGSVLGVIDLLGLRNRVDPRAFDRRIKRLIADGVLTGPVSTRAGNSSKLEYDVYLFLERAYE